MSSAQVKELLDDHYLPKNECPMIEPKPYLRAYHAFPAPKFYQGPAWRFVREISRNENSKDKKVHDTELERADIKIDQKRPRGDQSFSSESSDHEEVKKSSKIPRSKAHEPSAYQQRFKKDKPQKAKINTSALRAEKMAGFIKQEELIFSEKFTKADKAEKKAAMKKLADKAAGSKGAHDRQKDHTSKDAAKDKKSYTNSGSAPYDSKSQPAGLVLDKKHEERGDASRFGARGGLKSSVRQQHQPKQQHEAKKQRQEQPEKKKPSKKDPGNKNSKKKHGESSEEEFSYDSEDFEVMMDDDFDDEVIEFDDSDDSGDDDGSYGSYNGLLDAGEEMYALTKEEKEILMGGGYLVYDGDNNRMKAHRKGGKKKQQQQEVDEFDFKREKRLANKVLSLGKNKQEHKAKELEAKHKRQGLEEESRLIKAELKALRKAEKKAFKQELKDKKKEIKRKQKEHQQQQREPLLKIKQESVDRLQEQKKKDFGKKDKQHHGKQGHADEKPNHGNRRLPPVNEDRQKNNKQDWKPKDQKQAKGQLFDEHLRPMTEEEVEHKVTKEGLVKGIVKASSKNPRLVFISVPELDVDIMVDGARAINRAMDGDTVLVKLDAASRWRQRDVKTLQQAASSAKAPTAGKVEEASPATKGYSNTKAVEVRTVDLAPGKQEAQEDSAKQAVKPTGKAAAVEENNDSSDGEWEDVDSSGDENANSGDDGWEDVDSDQTDSSRAKPQVSKKSKENPETAKKSTKKDKKTTLPAPKDIPHNLKHADRIAMINDIAKTHRPSGKIVHLIDTPHREQAMLCTMVFLNEKAGSKQDKKKKGKKKTDEEEEEPELVVLAKPMNQKLPWFQLTSTDAAFVKSQEGPGKPTNYYICRFQQWTTTQKKGVCTVVEKIGEAGNIEAESLRILHQFEICSEPYETEDAQPTENVHECLKPFTKGIDETTGEWKIPEEELAKRLDLRETRIFTIDPITAKDLDDALSITKISESVYEIGVHIADVSYFVTQGSDLDTEAQKRCTSTYFVHRVYPMLPRLLCERLCSLNPKVDRLAYSCFFMMNIETGKLVKGSKPRFARSVIRSCAKWNYELVQKILDKEITTETELPEEYRPQEQSFDAMVEDCFLMHKIAQKRRANRFDDGSVIFQNREFWFKLDQETLMPVQCQEQARIQSKHLVEEYMLMANILVAEYLLEYCKDKTLLRAHLDVDPQKKADLAEFFEKIGLQGIDLTNAKSVSHSMERIRQEGTPEQLTIFNRKFLTCLTQATYVTVEDKEPAKYQHYGLNFPVYTHFTSPIRRYADLLVHRLLTICLKEQEKTRELIENIDYSAYAELCTSKSLNARKAGKECQRLFQCLLLKQEGGPRVAECLIFDIEKRSVQIYIEEMNIHQRVQVADDSRIKEAELQGYDDADEEFQVVYRLKKPTHLAQGRMSLRQQEANAGSSLVDQDLPADEPSEETVVFKVFDKVKVLIETTTTFPLDLKCTLLFTKDDEEIFEKVQADMATRKSPSAPQVVASEPANDAE